MTWTDIAKCLSRHLCQALHGWLGMFCFLLCMKKKAYLLEKHEGKTDCQRPRVLAIEQVEPPCKPRSTPRNRRPPVTIPQAWITLV